MQFILENATKVSKTPPKSINNSWVFHAVKEQNNQEIEQYKRYVRQSGRVVIFSAQFIT